MPSFNNQTYMFFQRDAISEVNKPERIIEDRIDLWKQETLSFPVDRVLALSGLPGVGQTRMAKYFCETKRQGVYVDLNGFAEYRTPTEYVSNIRTRIRQETSQAENRHVFFVDHVPGTPLHPNLKEVENRIFFPALEDGALLVMFQQLPHSWCWDRIPHPPVTKIGYLNRTDTRKISTEIRNLLPENGERGYELFLMLLLCYRAWSLLGARCVLPSKESR